MCIYLVYDSLLEHCMTANQQILDFIYYLRLDFLKIIMYINYFFKKKYQLRNKCPMN